MDPDNYLHASILLYAHADRLQALDALKDNIIDGVGGYDETLAFIEDLKLVDKTDKGVYGLLKREMWRETLEYLENWDEQSVKDTQTMLATSRENARREQAIRLWESKAKL